MTDSIYLNKKKQYARPQAILFSNNSGTISNGIYVPDGLEIGNSTNDSGDFLILSDHNRSPIDITPQRIENRQRMVNGRMRSYWVADKRKLSVSWNMLPSRAYNTDPNFDANGASTANEYTVDGGAGGVELLDWYENHYGTFWVFLAYDKYSEFPVNGVSGNKNQNSFTHLNEYNERLEMYITNFTYSIQKRGGTNFDMWNIQMSLEEA